MSVLGFIGIALSAVLLMVALITASIPIAYMALAAIAFVVIDAYRAMTHPQDPLI
jgi:multidrug transporter EmrE-like cation transporter